MRENDKTLLKKKIDDAVLVSFDIFDTLLFRKTNDPETIFDLVGRHFGIHGFRKLRMDGQNEADRRVYTHKQYPHAGIDEIYEVLAEHNEIPVNWEEVKEYEIRMEKDALVANKEMLEFFRYAKETGKRVVATSDMYLSADTLREILKSCGFVGFDYVYCSADEHKAKFNRELFELMASREKVSYTDILHIGDDGEYPAGYGIQTFIYERNVDLDKLQNAPASEIDNGLYKILYNEEQGFWYNIGVEAGGPLYMGLYLWMRDKIKQTEKKVYFLSRDGYNLYHIFRDAGYKNVEYLYTSKRALLLAGITEMNEEDINELPPYTKGQTIADILDYLCVPAEKINHLSEVGFADTQDVINTDEDIVNFKKLYSLNREVFLERCSYERENARTYLAQTGILDDDSFVFDCGWSGSSQYLLDRFKKAIGCQYRSYFYYFGIRNVEKSRRQLHGKHYETYAFDFYTNYILQGDISQAVALYEMFFSAPHESVHYYAPEGPIYETRNEGMVKDRILDGIRAYLEEGIAFATEYPVEYTPETATGHLQRMIVKPTEEEAVLIGNMNSVDCFTCQNGGEKYIAYVTEQQYERNPDVEICWMKGLFARRDIPEELKMKIADVRGMVYPEPAPSMYRLEDQQSIINYHRWIRIKESSEEEIVELDYKPKFSVVVPVYNTVTEQLKAAIDSVLAQVYENYELILVDDHSSWDNVVPVLQSYESNSHVQVIYRETNGRISTATNDGIDRASGEFIVFMDCDDTIEKDALYQFAKKLNENPELDFIYSDEDKITEDGKIRHRPAFKPEWSPEMFMSMMYTNHLAIYRLSIVKELGGLRTAYNGSQDYDMTLRFMEKTDNKRVGHIPRILYHWRERKESVAYLMSSKNYAAEAARYAKEDALRRRKIKGHLEYIGGLCQYRVIYEPVGEPLVSIVIPSKDHPGILKQCIDSIHEFTDYRNYEIIVVDNGSSQANRKEIEEYLKTAGAQYLYDIYSFNFSEMCNIGVKNSRGEYLLFLNDDVEVFQKDWLYRMVGQAMQEGIGAVGAKLFYPESTIIQHAGVTNEEAGPGHNFWPLDDAVPHGLGYNWIDYDCIAVTGACLIVSRSIFDQVGGFDENLPITYNDVDFCVKIHEAGYYNVIRNDVIAYHHESLSRGSDVLDDEKVMRLSYERHALYRKHPMLRDCDPFVNPNLWKYGSCLLLREKYDKVEYADIDHSVQDAKGNVDMMEISDVIRILGWSCIPERTDNAELDRYLLLMDIYDNLYRVPVCNMKRPDVVSEFDGREDLLYCGFECVLDKSVVRTDILQYKTGVQVIDPEGVSHIQWTPVVTNVIRNPKPRQIYCDFKQLSSAHEYPQNKYIRWNVDSYKEDEKGYYIRGWIICDGNNHYKYKKKLLLTAKDRRQLLFDIIEEERPDVALAFPELHFLYYTGFSCNIYKGDLEQRVEYDAAIRVTNLFDQDDVSDVAIGEKVIGKFRYE